jgi:3D (Asp-Asp-Asp) domain-containing protein
LTEAATTQTSSSSPSLVSAAPPTGASPEPSTAAPEAPPASSGRSITVSATGYALPGRTATGLPVGWGVVAVDPSVIPLGTHMTIPGYGEAVAADTGGAIVGATIDLWFPSVSQALAWGRRTVTITLH